MNVADREFYASSTSLEQQAKEDLVEKVLDGFDIDGPGWPQRADMLYSHLCRAGIARVKCPILLCGPLQTVIGNDLYSIRRHRFYSVEAWASDQPALREPTQCYSPSQDAVVNQGAPLLICGREVRRQDWLSINHRSRNYGSEMRTLSCVIDTPVL